MLMCVCVFWKYTDEGEVFRLLYQRGEAEWLPEVGSHLTPFFKI